MAAEGNPDPIAALTAAVTGMQSDLREVKSDMVGMKSDMVGMKSDMREMKSDMREMKSDMREMKSETNILRLEMRGGFAELHNDLQDVRRNVGTVIDSLADFRREYNEHTHRDD